MFIAALFRIARTWKQPRCQLTDEWIKNWYIYTIEYYSVIKRDECESVELRWMNLELVIQSEVSQKEKNKYQIRSVAQSCPTLCDPWIAARQASQSITNSQSSLRLTSIKSVMPSSHLILCHPLLLLPSIPPDKGLLYNTGNSTQYSLCCA